MKKLLLLFALAIVYLFSSCGRENKVPLLGYLTSKNLSSQLFTIDVTKDTTLTTAEGIKIKIPANSIHATSSTVTLEVKEALSIGEMLKAGLTTKSDKGILRSDGMFYINTKEPASIEKPISIEVPTEYADNSMQLYKGKEEDGRVMWEKPEELQTTTDPGIESGKALFIANCASCHKVANRMTGPALGWVTKRRSKEWLREFTKNSAAVLASGDSYACCIFNYYGKVCMTPFPSLTVNDLDNIYKYIERESKRLKLPEDIGANTCDSCKGRSEDMLRLLQEKRQLIDSNGSMVDLNYVRDAEGNGSIGRGMRDEVGDTPKVSPPNFNAEYYQFKITLFGWYNIDDLINNENFSETELKVQLNSPQTRHINMYLAIPTQKIFTEGGPLSNEKYWGFYELDGKIKLPHNSQAYIIAIGEEAGKTYFGSTQFTIREKQTLTVNMIEKSKDLIVRNMGEIELKNIDFEINKSKNYDRLKAVQESIDSLDRLQGICGCGSTVADSAIMLK